MRVSLHEGGLHDLVGCRVIAQPPVRQPMDAALVPRDECLEAFLAPGERAGDERFVVHAARTSTCEGVSLLRPLSWPWPCGGGACARGVSSCKGSSTCGASCGARRDERDACDGWRPSRAAPPGWSTARARPGRRAGCASSW